MGDKKDLFRMEGFFCVFLLVIMTVIMFVEVVARYIFGTSFMWIEELTRYLFIWLTFTGAAYVTATQSHIKVDATLALFPKKAQPIVKKIGLFIWLLFSIVITYVGFEYSFTMLEVGGDSPAMGLAKGIVYLGIPLGYLLMSIRLTVQLFRKNMNPTQQDVQV
ncbi:TRAP transporter small permease [Siminovitchia sp. FSL H7-0308]|uniref:TRAP-type C4-dicarboxylate transport system permease small subunit n=1 Tax=Siminovitchia thermophila TaxID=1245522 RepID=A0ABS2R8C5_9BACI|nr:TRAP transporter small permease [Siminovitchia thermophila]MBM7715893.1 TRAP-type C4-dicarboxylate transport system permease small subunit [Siminovitchia thermophila]